MQAHPFATHTKNSAICCDCKVSMQFLIYKNNNDGFAWIYFFKSLLISNKYSSLRHNSFYDNFKVDLIYFAE